MISCTDKDLVIGAEIKTTVRKMSKYEIWGNQTSQIVEEKEIVSL